MSLSPVVLYNAIYSDVCSHLPSGNVPAVFETPGARPENIAAASLLTSLLKKWEYKNTEDADDACRDKFFISNKRCKDWCLKLESSWDDQLYGSFLKEIDSFLHPSGRLLFDSYYYILEAGRCGPGSSLDARGQSSYAKLFSSPLSATKEVLYSMYSTYVRMYPEWSNAEIIRYEHYGAPSYVKSSRSSFVPKSQDISRMICTEPSLNMFFQLGLGSIIEQRMLRSFNLDLAVQPFVNQRLAQRGSLDGQFSTIDLSSASDSVSLNLCRSIFPDWFFKTLLELRTPKTEISGSVVDLDMVSTMGNGFTFPLQTLIFSCLIRAAYRNQGLPVCDEGDKNWGCFGDDLIVDKRAYRDVTRLLTILGFVTNDSKTFNTGHFRESCGSDWFLGHPVRGVYVKRLSSAQDIFVAINLLNDWSAMSGISLSCGIRYLLSGLTSQEKSFLVPFDENNDSGIRVPSSLLPKRNLDGNRSYIYRVYRPTKTVIRIGDGTIHVPRRCKKLIYNPSGLFLSFLRGEVISGMITVRQSRTLYRSKRRCSPNWDYLPTSTLHFGSKVDWKRWETASWLNHMV